MRGMHFQMSDRTQRSHPCSGSRLLYSNKFWPLPKKKWARARLARMHVSYEKETLRNLPVPVTPPLRTPPPPPPPPPPESVSSSRRGVRLAQQRSQLFRVCSCPAAPRNDHGLGWAPKFLPLNLLPAAGAAGTAEQAGPAPHKRGYLGTGCRVWLLGLQACQPVTRGRRGQGHSAAARHIILQSWG
jgi:hypothetical protein